MPLSQLDTWIIPPLRPRLGLHAHRNGRDIAAVRIQKDTIYNNCDTLVLLTSYNSVTTSVLLSGTFRKAAEHFVNLPQSHNKFSVFKTVMASKQALKRLTKEYKLIVQNPPPYITARPNEDNILEWHYVIEGPPDTPYAGGQYHGTLTFPSDYPYKPPAIRMITPNGRFKENTRLCLSMSDYHPDLWNPSWSVSTILTGLLSFMTGDEATTGSINTTDLQKRVLAGKSMEYNTHANRRFKVVFPEIVEANIKALQNRAHKQDPEVAQALENAQKQRNPIAEAAKEKAVNLEDIDDPEDRIRAEEVLREMKQQEAAANGGSSPLYYVGAAILIIMLGLFMK
ncbi:E2 ubiquitin-conjugating protein [Maudiozyma humilis]|uniref:Ubiquitin-conjugating enzyme E2 6 n=1 Tax=Maudiozyma humilis TaxID=51915 RepID=A0AAV5RYT1_MAUHU|nr:E2 ubiquitin-conjugating protein [Kazachstania humilis]